MGLFEGSFGVIRGEVWVNALQGTLACCHACASATVYYMNPLPQPGLGCCGIVHSLRPRRGRCDAAVALRRGVLDARARGTPPSASPAAAAPRAPGKREVNIHPACSETRRWRATADDMVVAEPIACGAATHALLAPAAPPCGALTLTLTLTRVGC